MIDINSVSEELRRLIEGPEKNETIPGLGVVRFLVVCNGNAVEVLETATAVMRSVCLGFSQELTDEINWRSVLPVRFSGACAEEMSPEESEKWLKRWQSLSDQEREEEERNRAWSLDNWMYWMDPRERAWQWWDAIVVSPDRINVSLVVNSWPFGWGAVSWLFRGSGASDALPIGQATDE